MRYLFVPGVVLPQERAMGRNQECDRSNGVIGDDREGLQKAAGDTFRTPAVQTRAKPESGLAYRRT